MKGGTAEAVLAIHVTPKARTPGVTGYRDGVLRVAVKAPPERGKATAEALAVVASWLGIPAARVRLAGGATSRSKRLRISEISGADLRKRIESAIRRGPLRSG